MLPFEDYLTTKQAYELSGISPESLARACRRKTLKGVKHGEVWFIKRHDLETYLQNKPKGRVKRQDISHTPEP